MKYIGTYNVLLNYENLSAPCTALQVSDKRKKVSSSSGMQNSVKTSELLKYRVSHCVPERTEAIVKVRTSYRFIFTQCCYGDQNWRIRFMEHVACMGHILCIASFHHGTAALLHTQPASRDSRGAHDMIKDTLHLCLPLTARQQRSKYFINPMTFNPFHATNETSSSQTTSLLPMDICPSVHRVSYLNMQLMEGITTDIFSCHNIY
jgi:hypothetical protein